MILLQPIAPEEKNNMGDRLGSPRLSPAASRSRSPLCVLTILCLKLRGAIALGIKVLSLISAQWQGMSQKVTPFP
ncbi:hypothetical protein J0895_03590 [Phormidium pseudopriestleyi FRX01]|uniref:Uncharacterized protein n=1 Tax=Phormidium pseudopriestleyi FRX01 TaxID=1759528 RepID=A0ABS3FM93_9CYAN|nr:hypothetical protein [Phormidium pseudopriestleyi]MBO0348200.1 hypothetical protein [Phormidium pseudopriestleyi FRX01]